MLRESRSVVLRPLSTYSALLPLAPFGRACGVRMALGASRAHVLEKVAGQRFNALLCPRFGVMLVLTPDDPPEATATND